MRDTKQRRIILKVLKESTRHPSADEIYLEVKEFIPNISLGTVYRNLERLVQENMIRKIINADGQRRFDSTIEPHGHFRCINCGVIEDTPFGLELFKIPEDSSWMKDREIFEVQSEIVGLCPACKSKS